MALPTKRELPGSDWSQQFSPQPFLGKVVSKKSPPGRRLRRVSISIAAREKERRFRRCSSREDEERQQHKHMSCSVIRQYPELHTMCAVDRGRVAQGICRDSCKCARQLSLTMNAFGNHRACRQMRLPISPDPNTPVIAAAAPTAIPPIPPANSPPDATAMPSAAPRPTAILDWLWPVICFGFFLEAVGYRIIEIFKNTLARNSGNRFLLPCYADNRCRTGYTKQSNQKISSVHGFVTSRIWRR